MHRFYKNIFLFFVSPFLVCFFIPHFSFSQSANDSIGSPVIDTAAKASNPVSPPSSPSADKKEEIHSVVVMEFIKSKITHGADSTYFNILKISNTNAKPIEGTVKISVPQGWKIISQESTQVNILPGNTEIIPIRATIDRSANGGVSYVISATLNSNRPLISNKTQTSVSKSCYVTIPRKRKWDVIPVTRTVYFDRYTQHAPLQLKMVNKGNGYEVVKLELEIGSSLEMYGALGGRYFTSVELKPHKDTILSFPVKYIAPDESELWNRDFRKLTVRISATVDTTVKRTSVVYKYLESEYFNLMADKVTPLNIDVQLQNLLSDANPRLFFSPYGRIMLSNDDIIDYNFRFTNIPFVGYNDVTELGDYLWTRSRMVASYTSDNWEVKVGDITSYRSNLLGVFGRGVGGSYDINDRNTIGGAVTASINSPKYSGNLFHKIDFSKGKFLSSSVNTIVDDYNKLSVYSASLLFNYPFLVGHNVSLMISPSVTNHNYNNQTFTDQSGNFIITNDPGASRIGVASQLIYHMRLKKITASTNLLYSTRDYWQQYSGRIRMHSSAQYFLSKKYYLSAASNLYLHDPLNYYRGIEVLQNKFLNGIHKVEMAGKMTQRLTLFAGPVLEHLTYQALKYDYDIADTIKTRFSSISPKLSLRCNYKNNVSGVISPYTLIGYTFITSANDSTIDISTSSPLVAKNSYFSARAGLNIIQSNWGLNVFYYIGPNNITSQRDYYYFGSYSKSIRIMPYFQKYYFNKKLLVSSYNSYYYEVLTSNERISLNGRAKFFLDHDWSFFVDNTIHLSSRITNENQKAYGRSYYLNLGVHKSFDLPQPRLKYYDLKVICFKDINGNGMMDDDEQGLPDIIITIDRNTVKKDSITKKPIKQPGQFSPAELVTDNFGQIIYHKIPAGEYGIKVYPLNNLVDLFNIKGQDQNTFITSDTTYYVPFVQSYRVIGKIIINRDEYSSYGAVSLASIRITATDSIGNSFPALTTFDGTYTLYVPQAGEYKVTINNVFNSEQFTLQESEYTVSFDGAKEFQVDFIFNEKKRKINMNGSSGSTNTLPPNPSSLNPNQPGDAALTSGAASDSAASLKPAPAPPNSSVRYRIQIAVSPVKLTPEQQAQKFKGLETIKEYSEGGIYKYTSGDFATFEFDKATDYKDKLKASGYKDAFIVFFKGDKRVK